MIYLTPQESQDAYIKRVKEYHDAVKQDFRKEINERIFFYPNGGRSFHFWFKDLYNMTQEQLEIVLKEVESYAWYARITDIKTSRYRTQSTWVYYDISPTPFESPKPNTFIQKIKEFFSTYFCDP